MQVQLLSSPPQLNTENKLKSYLVMKCSYGDFDIPISTPIYVHEDPEVINAKVDELNANRSKQDLKDEIEYEKRWVKHL